MSARVCARARVCACVCVRVHVRVRVRVRVRTRALGEHFGVQTLTVYLFLWL